MFNFLHKKTTISMFRSTDLKTFKKIFTLWYNTFKFVKSGFAHSRKGKVLSQKFQKAFITYMQVI